MSPMLDVQKAHLEVFRIRFGEKKGNSPARLTDAMRVTSENPKIVDAFTEAYGGERRPWDTTKWEAYLPITELSVVLLPGQSITQWWEKYKGSVCERRCDGQVEQKSGQACADLGCDPDPERRTKNAKMCTPTTRVNVICPDVKVAGSGMFVCHGLIGAKTLPRAVATAEAALRAGIYVPATVRVVEMVGAGTKWIVPKIEIVGVSLEDMIEAASTQEAIGAGRGRILGVSTGNGNGNGAPAIEAPSTLREQFDTNGKPAQPSTRRNAAEPIAHSGLAPRTAADAGMDEIDGDEYAEIVGDEHAPSSPTGEEPPGSAPAGSAGSSRPVNRVAIAAREAGLDDDGRHDLAEWASGGRVRSSAALSEAERDRALDGAAKIKDGHARLVREGDENAVGLKDTRYGWPTGDPVTAPSDPVTVAGDAPFTYAEIDTMKGPQLVDALRAAGLQVGGTVGEMKERLAGHYGLGEEPF